MEVIYSKISKGLLLIFSVFLFIFPSLTFGETLKDLVSRIDSLTPQQIREEIEKLPQEEKLKLQILLLSYAGKDKKAGEIIKRIYNRKLISNVLVLPRNSYAVVVDKTNEIVYVVKMNEGAPVVVKKYSCITGKRPGDKLEEGDQRTPEGIYFPEYWTSQLPPIYGIGAFPLNYPNILDRKILRRNGHGIWIHGTNNPRRPPHSSNGCIVLKNQDLEELKKFIVPKRTPVVIVSKLSFSSREAFVSEKKSLIGFVLRWKRYWENTPENLEPYLSLYDENFVWERGGIKSWIRHKERVTKKKKWIRIKLSDLTIIKDGRILKFGNLYVVRVKVKYRSNNYSSDTNKILYVIKRKGKWKILAEENL
jgi:murein L,D-transpeptidase YafK